MYSPPRHVHMYLVHHPDTIYYGQPYFDYCLRNIFLVISPARLNSIHPSHPQSSKPQTPFPPPLYNDLADHSLQ